MAERNEHERSERPIKRQVERLLDQLDVLEKHGEPGAAQIARILQRMSRSPQLRAAVAEFGERPVLKKLARDIDEWLPLLAVQYGTISAEPRRKSRRKQTLGGLRRSRAYRQVVEGTQEVKYLPVQQPVFADGTDHAARVPVEHHDVLVIAPKGVHRDNEHYRVPVRKVPVAQPAKAKNGREHTPVPSDPTKSTVPSVVGAYDRPPELMDMYDLGQRHTMAVARPQDWGHAGFRETDRGPAICTIPIKPEPGATSCVACYLLNAQNLNYRNAWTAEEWNDVPDGPDLPPTRSVDATTLDVLIAGPRGLVFRLDLRNLNGWTLGDPVRLSIQKGADTLEAGSVTCIDLSLQMEIWQQLRNGCVAGRVLFDDEGTKRVVPLVNITTLTPE